MTDSIFASIARGEQDAEVVLDRDQVMAILDIQPARSGHSVLFPKEPFQVLGQLPDDLLIELFSALQDLRIATVRCEETVTGLTSVIQQGTAAGQRAPHLLIHTIPEGVSLPAPTPTQDPERVRSALPRTPCPLEPVEPSRGLAEVRVTHEGADIFELLDQPSIADFARSINAASTALFESLETTGTLILVESGSTQETIGAEARVIALNEDLDPLWEPQPAADLHEIASKLRRELSDDEHSEPEKVTNYLLDRLRRLP